MGPNHVLKSQVIFKPIGFRLVEHRGLNFQMSRTYVSSWETNQNCSYQTKILENKPKCLQTTQFDKTKKVV